MRFNRFLVLPLAVLALGVLPACSGDAGDGDDNDADAGTGTDAGTGGAADAGAIVFPAAGPDPGASPASTCPANAIICESFDQGLTGWRVGKQYANVEASNGRLHVITANGVNESSNQDIDAMGRLEKDIPAFGTQLFVRAHVYMDSLPPVFGLMGTFFVLYNLDNNDFGGIELQSISDRGIALDNWTGNGTGWNRSPSPVPTNTGLHARRWMCLEWELRRSSPTAATGIGRAYVDGGLVYEFENVGMRGFKKFTVGYGFVHPAGKSASETYIDNVVVSSTARVGCQ
jgi:hypothetical protein